MDIVNRTTAPGRRPAVICDLDGTLVDVGSTLHHITVHKNMDAFHSETNRLAPPVEWVRSWCEHQHHELGHAVVMLTGRSAKYAEGTIDWLGRHVTTFEFHGPIMRRDRDFRPDHAVKREAFALLGSMGYDIVGAIDDRPQVLALWRELGLDPVVTVRPDWAESGEHYSDADLTAWADQEALRRAHGWSPEGQAVPA